MSGRKNIFILSGFVLSVSLITSSLMIVLASRYYSRQQFKLLNSVCGEILEQEPEAESVLTASLKKYTDGFAANGMGGKDVLTAFGYRPSDFASLSHVRGILFAAAGFGAGLLIHTLTFLYRNKKESLRIQALTGYLEQANAGKAKVLGTSGEDDFSRLEDEIYKTVTFLYQTRDSAIQAKDDFAENLSNIAHQIKTPITAISLSVQAMEKEYKRAREEGLKQDQRKNPDQKHLEQIRRQLLRLTHLEEALLVLARLDAGTLVFQKEPIDVLTVLVLAADNLQELFAQSGTAIDIPELGEMAVRADLDWTMEALMNLMKNCMEHNQGGTVHCSYNQNPLYTEIRIWDEGKGFAREDIPHLFERFYRGHNAREGGIGIGLALAKEIIERQNGTIRAGNLPGAGACFEIRFYSH